MDATTRDLFAHFFQPILKTCPACGADDCARWLQVWEAIGPETKRLPSALTHEMGRWTG